jgi:ribonucleoside-diphosphate reductase alpha chain
MTAFDPNNLPTHPEWLTEEAQQVLGKGYLLPGETPRDMWKRCASTAEKHLKIDGIGDDILEMFWRGYLGGATPVLSNFGTNRGLAISCYSVHSSDSVSSIYSHLKEVAALSKNGGGVGIYFGDIRPSGAPIASGGKSTGVVPWMRQYDLAASVVSQGNTRRGSFALYLPIDHPDLMEALRCKDHTQGDPRNFIDSNLAVTVTDEWIESMLAGDKDKQAIFGEVLKCRMMTGSPYIVYIDNANNQAPDCFKQRNLKISTSNLCFTGDTLVAVADGRNSVAIADLEGTEFPVYSARKSKTHDRWVTEIKPAKAFKTGTREVVEVELDDGSTFRCTPDHLLATRDVKWVEAADSVGCTIEPFTSFRNEFGHLMTNTHCDGHRRQARMIWEYYNGRSSAGFHVDHIQSGDDDSIENLQLLTKEKHFAKTAAERMGANNPIHKVDKVFRANITSATSSGKKNGRFNGIDNYQLIALGRTVYERRGTFTKADYLSLLDEGYNVPQHFSKYRFNESFKDYVAYVKGEKEYQGECEIEKELPINPRLVEKNALKERVKRLRKTGLKVVSVRSVGVEEVYDLTVEDNHNFFIITKEEKDFCSGLLVHNCSEIFLPTDENHTFVCVLSSLNLAKYDEWKGWKGARTGKTVPELCVYFLDAVVEEFIHKAERLPSMGRSVRFARKSRALGMGTMGLHALYQSRGLPFASKAARELNIEVHKNIEKLALQASQDMAREYGEPEWCEGNGVRHTTRTAIAPTKTNSVICGAVSEGIEPLVANLFVAGNAKGTFVRRNPYLEAHLEAIGQNTQEVWDSILERRGSVQHLECLSDTAREVFKTAREIDQFELVKQAADRQQFIDQGQSLNLFVDPEASAEYLMRLHLAAWKNGCLGLYYLKSSSLHAKQQGSASRASAPAKTALVVTKSGCPWCVKAKELLASHGYVIQEQDRSLFADDEWKWDTVPQIWLNGQHIPGGYQGLEQHLGMGVADSGEGDYAECLACQG